VEQWWTHNGKLVKVDGVPDEYGFITEVKWAGPATPGGFNRSTYNPLHADTVFNESTTIDQVQRLLGLKPWVAGVSGMRFRAQVAPRSIERSAGTGSRRSWKAVHFRSITFLSEGEADA
jgi:hypothetical protein